MKSGKRRVLLDSTGHFISVVVLECVVSAPTDPQGRTGDVGWYAGPALPDDWLKAPLGHFTSAHEAFGWCCLEQNRSPLEELWAWRLRYECEQINQA